MHRFLRNLATTFLEDSRFVFETRGSMGPAPAPTPGPKPGPKDPDVGPVGHVLHTLEEEVRKHEAEVRQTKLPEEIEMDREQEEEEILEKAREARNSLGEASDYAKTFKESPKFELLTTVLQSSMEHGGFGLPESYERFEDWLTMPPERIAALFSDPQYKALIPSGGGKDAFVNGFRHGEFKEGDTSPDAVAYFKSRAALEQIVATLREHFKVVRDSTRDVAKQVNQHPMGETIGTGIKTLRENYRRADGTEKCMILGALGIALALAMRWKDQPMPLTGWKWKNFFLAAGAVLGVNYLSGKVSPDGRTLAQRADIGRGVDKLSEDNVFGKYFVDEGAGENEEETRTINVLLAHGVDAKKMYKLYNEVEKSDHVKKEIDPKKLGFHKGEINGKAAYKLMKHLVETTSENMEITKLQEEEKFLGKRQEWTETRQARARQSGAARKNFEKKYLFGPQGSLPLTYSNVVMNEAILANAQQEWRKGHDITEAGLAAEAVSQDKASRLPDKAYDRVKTFIKKDIPEKYKQYKAEYKDWWIYRQGRDVYKFCRDRVAVPLWTGAAARFNKYYPKVEQPIQDMLASDQEETLRSVLPSSMAVRVTNPETNWMGPEKEDMGRVTINGFPNIPFEIKVRGDGKDVIVISGQVSKRGEMKNGYEFLLDEGTGGSNTKTALALESAVSGNIQDLVEKKKIAELNQTRPVWRNEQWMIDGIIVPKAPGTTTPIECKVFVTDKGETDVKFEIHGREISDFSKLDTLYSEATSEQELWNDPTYGATLKGMPLSVANGTIGGLKYPAGFLTTKPLDVSTLVMQQGNGGAEFIDRKVALVGASPEFEGAYRKLEALMDNTGENAWARIKTLFGEKSFTGAINGKILQRQWKFILEGKRMEALDQFAVSLQGKDVSQVQAVYMDTINNHIKKLETLARDIEASTDDQKADRFQSFADELETTNYSNPGYRALYKEYKAMISSDRYPKKGVESLSDIGTDNWSVADETFKIDQVLLRVWSYNTEKFAIRDSVALHPGDEIDPNNQQAIRLGVIEKVRERLEELVKKGGGKIRYEDLPPHETNEDLERWVNPHGQVGVGWERSRAIDEWKMRADAGTESEHQPLEHRKMDISINPTPEVLYGTADQDGSKAEHGMVKKMRKTLNDLFPRRLTSKFSGSVSDQYWRLLNDLPEIYATQAVVENGSEEEALERFETKIKEIRDYADNTKDIAMVWVKIKELFGWFVEDQAWDLEGENLNLAEDRPIRAKDKTGVMNQMVRLEAFYKERLEDAHGGLLKIDDYDEDALKFFEEVEKPMYRELFINRAIILKQDPTSLAEMYSEFLKHSYRECLAAASRPGQEAVDAGEINTRQTDTRWRDILETMKKRVSARTDH